MKKFRFQTSLTDSERYKVMVQIVIISNIFKRLAIFLVIPIFVIVSFFVTTGAENISLSIIWSVFPIFIFPLLMIFVFFILPFFIVKFGKRSNPIYEFSDWGMTVVNKDKTLNVPWENLEAYLESGKYIFLQTTKSKVYGFFIQKSMIEDGKDIKEFIDYLGEQRLKRR